MSLCRLGIHQWTVYTTTLVLPWHLHRRCNRCDKYKKRPVHKSAEFLVLFYSPEW